MHPLHLITITPLQPISVQNSAPVKPVTEICVPLFTSIIENSMRGTDEQIKTICSYYLDQFLQIDSEKSYPERVARFTTLWKKFFFPKLHASQTVKYTNLKNAFYCVMNCQAARVALYQATQQEVSQYTCQPSIPENTLFTLLDYFWKEDWHALIQCLDTPFSETTLKPVFNQIRAIAEIESLRQSGTRSDFIITRLKNLHAWQQLNPLPFEEMQIYNFIREDQVKFATVGTEILNRKYPHLITYFLIKKYHVKMITSLPFLWKLLEENSQQTPLTTIPRLPIAQLSGLQRSTSNELIPKLVEPFELFVSFFKDSHKVPSLTEFSEIVVKFKKTFPRSNGYYSLDQKTNYDTFLAFWYKVLERAQSEDPVRNYQDFFSKCSLVLRRLLSKEHLHIALAFLGALIRLDPNPVFAFLEQTYQMKAHLAFWKKEWENFQSICTHYNRPNLDLLSCMLYARYSDVSTASVFEPFPLPKEQLALLEKAFSKKSRHTSMNLFREIKKHFGPLASYLALKNHPDDFDFHPLFLSAYFNHFQEMSVQNHWGDLRKNLIDKLQSAIMLGRPLKALETIYNKNKDELFAIPAYQSSASLSTGTTSHSSTEEISTLLFDSIIKHTGQYPLTPTDLRQKGYQTSISFFLRMHADKGFPEQLAGFMASWRTSFFPKLEGFSTLKKCAILGTAFSCVTDHLPASQALFNVVLEKLPVLSLFEEGLLFLLLGLFWEENWYTIKTLLDTSTGSSYEGSRNILEVRVIAEIEGLSSNSWDADLKLKQLESLAAWKQLRVPFQEKILFHQFLRETLSGREAYQIGLFGLTDKYPILACYLLIKDGSKMTSSSPFLWKIMLDRLKLKSHPLVVKSVESHSSCPLTVLTRAILARAEAWKSKEPEQQKVFIRSKIAGLTERELDQLVTFLAIPEYVGCYSSQSDLLKLKQAYPQLFGECLKKQPENPFIQLMQ